MLEGPESIEVTDKQLEKLKSNYESLSNEIQELLHDFFVPLNMMRDTGVFEGKAANNFVTFCDLVQYYFELQIQNATEQFEHASISFENDILEAETTI